MLAKDGGEDGEVGGFGLGAHDVFDGMAGGGDEEVVGGRWAVGSEVEKFADGAGRDVVGAEVDAVGVGGQGYVGAGVDEEASTGAYVFFSVGGCGWQGAQGGYGFCRQRFEIAGAQIFFAELDVVDSGVGCFGDLLEQSAATFLFVAAKLGTVGDVVELAAIGHRSQRTTATPVISCRPLRVRLLPMLVSLLKFGKEWARGW